MARPRSLRILNIKQDILSRIEEGYLRPGDAFFSNRSLARRYDISYQTAHRIVSELTQEGLLIREVGAGTFIAGDSRIPESLDIIMNTRAKITGSFGHFLMNLLVEKLDALEIPYSLRYQYGSISFQHRTYPILWECPTLLPKLAKSKGFGMLLSNRPPPGLTNPFIDSVEIDDFAGGILAAQVLKKRTKSKDIIVIGGPKNDLRSKRRIQGFQEILPQATILHTRKWHYESALSVVDKLGQYQPDGIFCANDRLAQAVHFYYKAQKRSAPPILGFDDAPISREQQISTIGIPWEEFIDAVAERAKLRLSGYNGTAARTILAPRIIHRDTL